MRRDVGRPLGDDVARCQPADQKDGVTPGAEAAEERNQDALAVAGNIDTVFSQYLGLCHSGPASFVSRR